MLTDSQRQAIETDDREVLVIAGPGSGKTFTLIERIARVLEQGTAPESMMGLTFTRRAAHQMRRRLAARLGDEGLVGRLMLDTFHAISLRILESYADCLGYPWTITVAPADEAGAYLRQVAQELGFLRRGKWRFGCSLTRLRSYVEAHYTGAEWSGTEQHADTYDRILREYHSRLRAMGVVDFGQILHEVHRLFREYPKALTAWQERIKHVFVDELQDTDRVQFNLHQYFDTPDSTFFAVCDPRQCVYSWRGARPDLVRSLHPRATIINLAESFRCPDAVICVANGVIADDTDNPHVPIVGNTQREGRVDELDCDAAELVERIRALHNEDAYAWGDIAVLARTHSWLGWVKRLLSDAGIPCQDKDATPYQPTTGEARTSALLRLIVNPNDELAMMTFVGGIDVNSLIVAQLRHLAHEQGCTMFDCLRNVPTNEEVASSTADITADTPLAVAIDRMGSVADDCARAFWLEHCADMTVGDAVSWFATWQPDRGDWQEKDDAADAVWLVTMHAAKGLEWPAVVIVGAQEGYVPHSRSLASQSALNEERRLFYVGITRARERLILHRMPESERTRFLETATSRSAAALTLA